MSDPTFDPASPQDDLERAFDAIRDWLRAASGLTDVTWSHEPDDFVDPTQQARLQLTMMSCVDVGMDEIRREFDENDETQAVAQVGIRLVVVQIVAESFTNRPAAMVLLERIRKFAQGVRLSHAREIRVKNISVNQMGTSLNLPKSYDQRVVSVASADFTFNVASVKPSAPEDWIEEVDAEGDFS